MFEGVGRGSVSLFPGPPYSILLMAVTCKDSSCFRHLSSAAYLAASTSARLSTSSWFTYVMSLQGVKHRRLRAWVSKTFSSPQPIAFACTRVGKQDTLFISAYGKCR